MSFAAVDVACDNRPRVPRKEKAGFSVTDAAFWERSGMRRIFHAATSLESEDAIFLLLKPVPWIKQQICAFARGLESVTRAMVKTGIAKAISPEGRATTNPHAQWLSAAEIIERAKSYYGTLTLMFDRELATALLEMNTGNRRVNKRKLQQLGHQMRTGEFENTGEPLILSNDGIINNGQHRLLALVEADAVLDMDVRFGVPRKAFSKTDTGTPRSAGDVLTIKGVRSGSQISSAVRLLVLYERGLPESVREFVSNDEVSQAFDRWSDIEDVAAAVNQHALPKAVRSTPFFATAFLASRTPARGKLERWLDAVATGLDVARDHPAYQLRERLMRGVDAPVGTREGQLERFALMIKSWNLWARGETVTMREFRWTSSGRNAEPFPKVLGAKLNS